MLGYRKKILYITHNEIYIKNKLNEYSVNFENLIFSTPLSSFDSKINFDLVIFDDISGISVIEDSFVLPFLKNISSNKKIILSMSELLTNNKVYEINDELVLFKEPRSIQTKIDLNYDMPHVVFEFLEWFMLNETKVILITKDSDSSKNVYSYMKKYVSFSSKLNNVFIDNNFKSFCDFESNVKLNSYIYITSICFFNEFQEFIFKDKSKVHNFNIVVFFASDRVFNYKNLLSLCGMSNFLKDCKNEVIFVSNYENMEILMAKRISRSYNKRLWEFGLRKY